MEEHTTNSKVGTHRLGRQSSPDLFSVTFKHFGIGVKWVTENNPQAFAAAIDDKTKAIYVESIANPKYILSDIPALAKVRSHESYFCARNQKQTAFVPSIDRP